MDKEMKDAKKTKGFLAGFLIGGAIGGAIALLYAPKSGKQLRDDISRKTNELIGEGKIRTDRLWSNAKEEVETTLESANDFLNTSKEMIMNKAGKAKDAIKAGVSAYNEKRKAGGEENISSAAGNENTNSIK